uniref:DUF834 domain-containing protein n=1 Tax=Oryza meridionalis TaxID=40149 RepID=A0A0E0CCN7_9ORYZ
MAVGRRRGGGRSWRRGEARRGRAAASPGGDEAQTSNDGRSRMRRWLVTEADADEAAAVMEVEGASGGGGSGAGGGTGGRGGAAVELSGRLWELTTSGGGRSRTR